MLDYLFLVFALPLAGFVTLAFARGRLPEIPAAFVGVGSIGGAFLVYLLCAYQFLTNPPEGGAYTQVLWQWMQVGNLDIRLALRFDGLSLAMTGVITGVGFFIHLFASWYMRGDEAYDRFLSYMNLFVASMLFLVLGDNLVFLYFGWEGVGLASYLLIGFWYKDAANGYAARKAFVITRVGDTFMAIGLFILFTHFGTLDIQELMSKVAVEWKDGPMIATIAALLMLGGACGKSAQLPLQTWLPDAMAGPTPVSALIHAATMVTAGVYLIARTHVLFEVSPIGLEAVGWVGGVTALMAGFIALQQTDIKRVLAYSTMSQIGYMFLALGAGAYQPAIFHLMTHAFFKALLFLSAGSVILALHHEQDIFKMGNLRRDLPFTFWVFLIGSLGLIAFPGTSGFFSKDEILFEAFAGGNMHLYYMGLFGAFMTGLYTFRMIFIAFFGEAHHHGVHKPHSKFAHDLPLAILAVAALLGGFIHLPLDSVLPRHEFSEEMEHKKHMLEAISVAVSLSGVGLAWLIFGRSRKRAEALRDSRNPILRWWGAAFGFDWLYDLIFVKPYLWFIRVNAKDVVDQGITLIPEAFKILNGWAAQTQNGMLRWYAAAIGAGAVVIVGAVVIL
ncbi:NADH dehydrogenase subunit L [Panacagrimonas perspica]|uniref:NADH dehydrogenase subunit L n=1 Tax=Panacagrimonas perspica TaxID=381431 RepID=A0A4S3K301_9GAMM|nr:NADH-quinone oxidoreductase subunit L [Panacagrimonas perspica]TDU28821.1 NADH dehydrogenase subunit L [Panacagrimonas perspica]THD02346.1 NADH-quinone oxidoreductase subunit L [Panacagrimonas perspica]